METFSKVELTVWPSYSLGGGLASHEAANNLRRRDVSWTTNFFETSRSIYVNGGGNGAAMRIQPHIWSTPSGSEGWRLDVVTNSVSTHGHMRGILGALFHGACLEWTLTTGSIPRPLEWRKLVSELSDVPRMIRGHDQLGHLWLGLWEQRNDVSLDQAVRAVSEEMLGYIQEIERIGTGPGSYESAVEALVAYRRDDRGSGTKTAILACLAALLFEGAPEAAVVMCANRLGTDTDSIATMAGALAGATTDDLPRDPICDRDYIELEAERMWAIREQRRPSNFPYPRLLSWAPPRTQLDCFGMTEGGVAVAGIGPADCHDHIIPARSGNTESGWTWVDLWFGQRILLKRRPRPKPLPESQLVHPAQQYLSITSSQGARPIARVDAGQPSDDPSLGPRTLHEITDEVIAADFDPLTAGRGLLELADRRHGIELAGQYAAILAKARLSRQDRDRRR